MLTLNSSFEFLGACSSDKTTRSPGPRSFTTALIWALKNLVADQKRFTVSELSRKIREAPDFPQDQVPVQFDRAPHAIERIVLAPLMDNKDGPAATLDNRTPQGLLHLNFIFAEPPSDKIIEKLAQALDRALKKEKMPINRIAWGGLSSWEGSQSSENGHLVIQAVNQFRKGLKGKKLNQGR